MRKRMIALILLLLGLPALAQPPLKDVTQPGDSIHVAFGSEPPSSESSLNLIDDLPSKWLLFFSANTGVVITPSIGLTLLEGISITAANDAPERDPVSFVLEGSYDGEDFEEMASGRLPAFTKRFHKNHVYFENRTPYLTYRLIFPEINGSTCCIQMAEIELLGKRLPADISHPGDFIASVTTCCGPDFPDRVVNAIDNRHDTKFVDFDISNTGLIYSSSFGLTEVIGFSLTAVADALETAPTTFLLEGSQDAQNFKRIASGNVPPFYDGHSTRYIFFENNSSFLYYRLVFPTVGETTCCMQIAEVEFFQKPQPECLDYTASHSLIRTQPDDAFVLEGATASFNVLPSGPFSVQWMSRRPGETAFSEIKGGTSARLEIWEVKPEWEGRVYKAVITTTACEIQESDEVVLHLFEPSDMVSVGVSWRGSGANGSPTDLMLEDVAGFHQQAYWNNLSGRSGNSGDGTWDPETGTNDRLLRDSHGEAVEMAVEFSTHGAWGVGTPTAHPRGRLLNGLVVTDSTDNLSDDTSSITLKGLDQGTYSILVYTVQVPLEFYDLNLELDDLNGVQKRFIRPQNSDQYNHSPEWLLVTAETESERSVGNMVRFDGVSPSVEGTIVLRFWAPNGSGLGPGINGLQLLIHPPVLPTNAITEGRVMYTPLDGNRIKLMFQGVLKSAALVEGPYEVVVDAQAPSHIIQADQKQQFFMALPQ